MGRNKYSMLIVFGWIVVRKCSARCIMHETGVASQAGYHVGSSDKKDISIQGYFGQSSKGVESCFSSDNKDISHQVYFGQSSEDADMMQKGVKQDQDPIQKRCNATEAQPKI